MSDTENTPQADASANLSPAVPQASAAEVKAAEAISGMLDPDLQAAILQGNSAIIQAVAAGATTNDQIAQRLISMGMTTGLPPGVQAMVNEQQDKIAQARKDEELSAERRAAALAAMVGGAMMGTLVADSSGNSSAPTRPYYMQDIFDMNAAQKYNYMNDLEDMSYSQYASQSEAERNKNNENVTKEAQTRLDTATKEKAAFEAKMKSDPNMGSTPEEQAANRAKMSAATDINLTGDESEAAIKKLPEHLQAAAREERKILRNEYYAQKALEYAEKEREALKSGDTELAWKYHTQAAGYNRAAYDKDMKDLSNDNAGVAQELAHQTGASSERTKSLLAESTATMRSADQNAQTFDEKRAVLAAQAENVAIGSRVDEKVVAAANKPQEDDAYGDTAPAQVAAAPRLTQDLTRLQLAGMLQPEGVGLDQVAANTSAAPQVSTPKATSPSGGMAV